MRKLVFALMSAGLAANFLGACAIPDDGKSDLKGTITVPADLAATVVLPGDAGADADCADATPWGESPIVGDVTPTVYVGLYTRPIDPTNDDFDPSDPTAWFNGCGEIDEDDDPATPTVPHRESCPVGGTTAVFEGEDADGQPVFSFDVLYVDNGDYFLYSWLDNKCSATNAPTTNLVWDLGGAPDAGDIVTGTPAAVTVNENEETFDGDPGASGIQPLVLGSAL